MRAANRPAGVSDGPERRTGAGWIVWLGIAAHFITLAKCAWLSDDYSITFWWFFVALVAVAPIGNVPCGRARTLGALGAGVPCPLPRRV